MDEVCGELDRLTGSFCTLAPHNTGHHVSREDPLTELHWDTSKVDAVLNEPPDEVVEVDDEEYEHAGSMALLMGEGWV